MFPKLVLLDNKHTLKTRDIAADDFPGPRPNPQHAKDQGGTGDGAEHLQTVGIEGMGDDVKITNEQFPSRWALLTRQGVGIGRDAARDNQLRVAAAYFRRCIRL
jgi:hypothetical protein